MRSVARQVKSCFDEIERFKKDFSHFLSEAVLNVFEIFLENNKSTFNGIDNDGNMGGMSTDSRDQLIIAALIKMGCFESDISYLLNDTEENIRKTVEIAFAHLKRLIVADESEKNKWQEAWTNNEREERFESFGGIHLLRHKIWAFKTIPHLEL